MSIEAAWLQVSGEVRLPFVEQGARAGVPTLFLHGFANSWRTFAPALSHLPHDVRAIAPTLRGHGEASKPPSGYREQDFADDAAHLLDGLQVDAAVLVGHSMGSAVAQRFALDQPGRTLGLVLVAGSIPSGEDPGVRAFYEEVVKGITDPVDPGLLRDFLATTLAQPIPDDLHEVLREDARCVPARVWREAFRTRLETDSTGEIDRIAAPTLLLWGDRDARSARSDQEKLLTAIAGARLRVYEGAGHELHLEDPERFAADVASFVREVTA